MAQGNAVKKHQLLVVGGSAGSLDAILRLLPALQTETHLAIVLVLHRRSGESVLAELLGDKTAMPVKEAEDKENIVAGTVYLAPADYHLLVETDRTFSLDYSEKVNYSRPSIDVTFETAAEAYGAACLALLLSGANHDGTAGLKKIKEAGGYVMVQDPAEALVAYMPQQAIDHVPVDIITPVANIPLIVQGLAAGAG